MLGVCEYKYLFVCLFVCLGSSLRSKGGDSLEEAVREVSSGQSMAVSEGTCVVVISILSSLVCSVCIVCV